MQVGTVIREIRMKKKISQGDLANRLNISQTYLSQLEKNKKTPSMDLMEKIAEVLGLPMYYFMLKGLEVDKDVKPEKQETYKQISPIIEGMIEKLFLEGETV